MEKAIKASTFVATIRKSGNSKVVTIPDAVAQLYPLRTKIRVTIMEEKEVS